MVSYIHTNTARNAKPRLSPPVVKTHKHMHCVSGHAQQLYNTVIIWLAPLIMRQIGMSKCEKCFINIGISVHVNIRVGGVGSPHSEDGCRLESQISEWSLLSPCLRGFSPGTTASGYLENLYCRSVNGCLSLYVNTLATGPGRSPPLAKYQLQLPCDVHYW